jgi:hypothetical protein
MSDANKTRRTGKQTFNLPRGDANQFTHIKKFLITDASYKLLANRPLWSSAFKTPEEQMKATKNQRWFIEGSTNDEGENIRIREANLQFDRYGIEYRMTPNAMVMKTDARSMQRTTAASETAPAIPTGLMPNPYHQYGYLPRIPYPFQTFAQGVHPFQPNTDQCNDSIDNQHEQSESPSVATKHEHSEPPSDVHKHRQFNPLKRRASETDNIITPAPAIDTAPALDTTANIIFTQSLPLLGTNITLQVINQGPITTQDVGTQTCLTYHDAAVQTANANNTHDRDADERVHDNDDAQEDSVTEYGVHI